MTTARQASGLLGCAAGFGILTFAQPAHAEPRTISVEVLGGKPIQLTVPQGTPLDQVALPPIDTPILSVSVSPPASSIPTHPGQVAAQPVAGATAGASQGGKSHRTARKRSPTHTRAVAEEAHRAVAEPRSVRPTARAVRVPTAADPTFTFAVPGAAPVGVPNFLIDKFRIPPFLLSIYQAAGIQYGVRWEVLAAINEIESDYGRNLSTSTAGAVGWMQFMPSTWKRYGVDANRDRSRDPYNPVDAIFAAARYLKAAGAEQDIRKALFAYNHADWYVDSVLMRARLIGGMPADLVGSLTGLTEGRFPVAATAKYAQGKQATNIFARAGAAVVAVQDAKVLGLGSKTVRIRDVYGNTYTYAHLARVVRTYSAPAKVKRVPDLELPAADPVPLLAATAGRQIASGSPTRVISSTTRATARLALHSSRAVAPVRERLQANPTTHLRTVKAKQASDALKSLRVGAKVPGGTVLGRIHDHVRFTIRPAGKGAPLIDPKPILDGWKLLESTAIYRARGVNVLQTKDPSIGQVLLMSKAQLQQRVLDDGRIDIYPGGREDVAGGQIDRRVLATIEFLAASGLKPTVSSLKGNHGYHTASGNVSEHSSGNAVDISKINDIPIIGHQGPGSIADITIRRLLTLQGTIKPHQIISLMTFQGVDNTLSLPDHADHIHVGFRPETVTVLKPLQWTRLIDRLGAIDNPAVDLG